MTDVLLNGIAQFLVFLQLIAFGYFVVDYVIIRPLIRVRFPDGTWAKKYVPWWRAGIGVMFAMLSTSVWLTDLNITLTLFFGSDYPGRLYVRVGLYLWGAIAAIVLAVVYGVEGRTERSVLVPPAEKADQEV
jgi:hypothetical protein